MGVVATSPWIGLSLLGLVYASLIPFGWRAYRRQEAAQQAAAHASSATASSEPAAPPLA
jgi:CDP-diacylglycerol--serine O-phosphatidyltransferase